MQAMRSVRAISLALLLLPALAGVAAGQAPSLIDTSPHITVSAEASEEVKPDMAILFLGTQSERKTAAEATADNARAGQAVLAEMRALGIEERDIRTRAVNLTPLYEDYAPSRPTRRTAIAFRAATNFEVRVRDVAKAGEIARQLLDRGANVFQGLTFQSSQRDERIEVLRTQALSKARARAEGYVKPLGISLGRVLKVEPTPGAVAVPMARQRPMAAAAPGDGSAPPPGLAIEPGLLELSASVSVTWELGGQ